MAGFFGLFDPTKPGKGVDPDQKKGSFATFWEIIGRKLTRLILLNLFYFAILSPIILLLYTVMYASVMGVTGYDISEIGTIVFQVLMSVAQPMPEWLRYVLLAASVIFYGPATCGLTYVLRNFAREEHAWVSDFFVRMMKNFKQGLFFGLLDIAVFSLMAFNISLLMGNEATVAAAGDMVQMFQGMAFVSLMLFVMYLFARHYFYLLAVTFESSVLQILRNSFIFAVLGLGRNILSTLLIIVIMVATLFLNPLVEIVMMFLFALSLCSFIEVYLAYPAVKKFMIDPIMAKKEEKAEEEEHTGFYPPVPKGDSLSDPIDYGDRKDKPWLPPEM